MVREHAPPSFPAAPCSSQRLKARHSFSQPSSGCSTQCIASRSSLLTARHSSLLLSSGSPTQHTCSFTSSATANCGTWSVATDRRTVSVATSHGTETAMDSTWLSTVHEIAGTFPVLVFVTDPAPHTLPVPAPWTIPAPYYMPIAMLPCTFRCQLFAPSRCQPFMPVQGLSQTEDWGIGRMD